MTKTRYAALFKSQTGNYVKFAYLEHDGRIPQPIIQIDNAEYIYAPDQNSIAKAFSTSQQNISRWIKHGAKHKQDKE